MAQALALAFWPFGHATRTATLREWPRCANDAGTFLRFNKWLPV
ncbi:hypothetical protein [Moorena sp. SIO1G6]|nr:hypothetical protein [Moorena sp. SIO1G6]